MNNGTKRNYERFDSLITDTGSRTITKKYINFDEIFWYKILNSSKGLDYLTSKDAERILTILKCEGEYETETKIATLIVNRLKSSGDLLDEGFLRYLSENYNKLIPISDENEIILRESEEDDYKNDKEIYKFDDNLTQVEILFY